METGRRSVKQVIGRWPFMTGKRQMSALCSPRQESLLVGQYTYAKKRVEEGSRPTEKERAWFVVAF
jgi:hypothetical protein